MPLNVFQLRESVMREYADYVNSFVNIHDDKVRRFVEKRLDEGELWPDPALQLNPAYEPAQTLGELGASGVIRGDRRLLRSRRTAVPPSAGRARRRSAQGQLCGKHGHRLRQKPNLPHPDIRRHNARRT